MSLQVWLPLNGDLHNQGISGLTFSYINSPYTTVNSSGKIGSCYTNSSHDQGGLISDTTINLGTKLSMFCWINVSEFYSTDNLSGVITNHHYQNCSGMGLTLRYNSSSTGYIGITEGHGSDRTYDTIYGNTLLNTNTWYHIGFTYDGSTITFYLNGAKDGTRYYSGISSASNYISIFRWSDTYDGYKLTGSLNDVRVYDHCLTPQEVKEISKGLVAHYTMYEPLKMYSEPDGSIWVHIAHHNNPANGNLFSSSDAFTGVVYKDTDRWFNVYSTVSQIDRFEFMVKQKETSSSEEVKYRWIQNKSPFSSSYSDVAPDAVTRVTTSGYTNGGYGGIYVLNSPTYLAIANYSNGNWYGAFGS